MQEKVEELVDHIKEYAGTQYELAVLKASDKSSQLLAGLTAIVVVAFIVVLALILLSFGLAFYISDKMGNHHSGFIIVGSGFLLIALIILAFKKSFIERPLTNKLIRSFLKEG
jgi:hypothetical protein